MLDMALGHERAMLSLNRNHIFVITYCCCIQNRLDSWAEEQKPSLRNQHCLEPNSNWFSLSQRVWTSWIPWIYFSLSWGKKIIIHDNNTPRPATTCITGIQLQSINFEHCIHIMWFFTETVFRGNYIVSQRFTQIWQSHVEIKVYSITYFDHITVQRAILLNFR